MGEVGIKFGRILAVIILILAGVGSILGLGNPQWGPTFYRFQATVWPGYTQKKVPIPEDHSGLWKTWDSEGQVDSIRHFKNGKIEGNCWTKYNEDLFEAARYSGTQIIGPRLLVNVNSKHLHSLDVCTYPATLGDDSIYVGFHANSAIKTTGEFKNNYKSGIWANYDQDENLIETLGYTSSERHGYSVNWTAGENPIKILEYVDGKLMAEYMPQDLPDIPKDHLGRLTVVDLSKELTSFSWLHKLVGERSFFDRIPK